MSPYDGYAKPISRGKRKRWIAFSVLATLIMLAIVGIVVGVTVAKKKENNRASTGNQAASGTSPTSNQGNGNNKPPIGGNPTNGNDPSVFPKDPNFHRSFYGMAYTPEGSQLPDCQNSLDGVIKDIQIMSQLTKRVRLYGADCNQSALVLEAIKQTKVDMQVWLGNYNLPDDNDAAYIRQRDVIKDVIQTYGTDNIAGITVGNEYMLNYLVKNGGGEANSALGDKGAALLVPNIQDTRAMLQGMGLNKNIPVGNSDAGSFFNTHVLEAIDYGLANVHAWFAHVPIDGAAQWTNTFFEQQDVNVANGLPNKPQMYIAETGWPTKSSDPATASNGPSDASEANLQTFLDTFVCQANQAGIGYFFFELFDEKWKDVQFGGVEGWWGLLNSEQVTSLSIFSIANI
ncbi:hypothetical protein AX17_002173 [Amanita inopinata Kibby_2008]|nr:hypothetical protein AX17_002173 [Amanita inopinata Kibby_2008]